MSYTPIESFTLPNLEGVKDCLAENFDFVLVITGGEGKGKSTAAIFAASVVDPTFTEERLFTDVDSLMLKYKEDFEKGLTNGKAYIFDEGVFGADDSRTMQGADFKRFITTMRSGNAFFIICVSTPKLLMSFLKNERVDCIWYIQRRGEITCYPKHRISDLQMRDGGIGDRIIWNPNQRAWADIWPEPGSEMWNRYVKVDMSKYQMSKKNGQLNLLDKIQHHIAKRQDTKAPKMVENMELLKMKMQFEKMKTKEVAKREKAKRAEELKLIKQKKVVWQSHENEKWRAVREKNKASV